MKNLDLAGMQAEMRDFHCLSHKDLLLPTANLFIFLSCSIQLSVSGNTIMMCGHEALKQKKLPHQVTIFLRL